MITTRESRRLRRHGWALPEHLDAINYDLDSFELLFEELHKGLAAESAARARLVNWALATVGAIFIAGGMSVIFRLGG